MRKTNRRLIFLIEDSPDIRDLVTLLYKGEGYAIEMACNGQQALEKLRQLPELPSFILLDLMMPEMDGYEFRKLQEAESDLVQIPIVVMSADANAESKAIAIGASGHIKKPFNVVTLLEVASRYCASPT